MKVLKERKLVRYGWGVFYRACRRFVRVFFLIFTMALRSEIRSEKNLIPDKVRGDLFYVRGILRNRFTGRVNDVVAMGLLVAAYQRGVAVETMMAYAKIVETWDIWLKDMNVEVDDDEISAANIGSGTVSGSCSSIWVDEDEMDSPF